MSAVKGKLFAITGAASGIGLATARLLADHGALLSLADMNWESLQEKDQELKEKDVKVYSQKVDVRDRAQVDDWIVATVKHFKTPLDGAANLAGIVGNLAPLREFDAQDYENVFAVNVKGIFHCMQAELKHMRVAENGLGGGSIVNAASVTGIKGLPYIATYSASKFAVVGITKSAAASEAATGIRINAVAPGFVDTPMMTKVDEGLEQPMPPNCLFDRRARPEEIAKLIIFLLSDDSSYTTGSVYNIDGGHVF